jgi:hypothetical protein
MQEQVVVELEDQEVLQLVVQVEQEVLDQQTALQVHR